MSKIIDNAAELSKMLQGRGPKHSEQTKKLLKLKIGQGFTTSKSKVVGLRVMAAKNNMKISARAAGSGSYLVYRVS